MAAAVLLCQKIGQREEAWRKDQVAAVGIDQVESIALAAVAAVRIGQVESIALAG